MIGDNISIKAEASTVTAESYKDNNYVETIIALKELSAIQIKG